MTNANFGVDGTWTDLVLGGTSRNGGTAISFSNYRATGIYKQLWKNNDEQHYDQAQFPHLWDKTAFYPHLHWEPDSTGTHTFDWVISWVGSPAVYTIGSVETGTPETVSINADYTAGNVYVTDFTPILPANPSISYLMSIRIKLQNRTAGGDVWVWGFDLHHRHTRAGTINIDSEP